MRVRGTATLFLLILAGCPGALPVLEPAPAPNPADPYAACTDPQKCCPDSERVCTGSPDRGLVCGCVSLWDCSKNPSKCDAEIPTPTGGGDWRCTWTESKYTCSQAGDKLTPPAAGQGWTCSFNAKREQWVCTMDYRPNPTNTPEGAGAWRCSVVVEFSKLVCKRVESAAPRDAGTGTTSPPPPATPPSPPRRDSGVTRAPDAASKPPADASKPAPDASVPPTGGECVPGQKMWCDGEQYCGWGMVECLADGKWKSKLVNGKRVIDCQERSDGKRPNTPCACYNVYFEPKCCEQANCILPAGTDGQLCGKSAGQLCDYCNAQKPECTGTGAKCLPLPGGQTICSRSCSKQNPCPTGYDCVPIFSGGAFGNVCIPKGGTCPPKA